MICRKSLQLLAVLCASAFAGAMAEAQSQSDSCLQVQSACRGAGFMAGKSGWPGRRVQLDCVEPLLDGRAAAKSDGLTLPAISGATIKACTLSLQGKARARSTIAARAAIVPVQPVPAAVGSPRRPNIVLILADDLSMDLVSDKGGILAKTMPNLAKMQREGATFTRFFVTDSLCCPSRTSLLTGKLPHNSGVYTNVPPSGGYRGFMDHGNEAASIAVALHGQSYLTSMNGKYLNGYKPESHPSPLGWSDWGVAGSGYVNFNVVVNENGTLVMHPEHLTDWLAAKGQSFIAKAGGQPFFLELAPFSPHGPYVPPTRYADSFDGMTYPRTPAFNARPNAAAPAWLRAIPPLSPDFIGVIDATFRDRLRSDRAIDDMIGSIRATLKDLGLAQNTYVIFTSDNGYHMGEFGLRPGKMTPFDTDIQVPLVVVGPGVAPGRTIPEIAMNIDLYPTFAELSGLPAAPQADGHSLVALLHGQPAGPWRSMAVIEHQQVSRNSDDPDLASPKAGDPPDYVALRMQDALYVEYGGSAPEVSYYDLTTDQYELNNIAPTLSPAMLQFLHQAAAANHACKGAASCWQAQSLRP